MLKRLRSECLIDLSIETDGPLLIKSGQATVSGVEMTAVRTQRNGRWEIYIPGSSIKGALRAQSERIARTLAPNGYGCCDPFADGSDGPVSCSARLEELKRTAQEDSSRGALGSREVYRNACPVCRLFGCLSMAGRLAFNDAYEQRSDVNNWAEYIVQRAQTVPPETLAKDIRSRLKTFRESAAREVVERSNVGIDRHTGGVASGPFDMEVVSAARFATSLYLRNFELWQLGLLGFVLRDLQEGLIKLGLGKSRGLGRIKAEVTGIEIRYLGLDPAPSEGDACRLWGMKGLESNDYGFSSAEQQPVALYPGEQTAENPVKAASDGFGLRTVYAFDGAQCDHLWRAVAPVWIKYARDNPNARTTGGS